MSEPATGALLDVAGLVVTAGGRTLLVVETLTVAAPDLVVIAGGAASGKTTLAAALAGSIPSTGSVRVGNRVVSGRPSQRTRAGLSAAVRDGSRISGCTVHEALRLAAGRSDRAAEALERFPLLAARHNTPAQVISGGEQQLLQVACAWCAGPRVLVLDSPTVGLAGPATAAVVDLARSTVAGGSVVVWLEQDGRAAPSAPAWLLVSGRLAAASTAPSAGPGGAAASRPAPGGEANR